MHAEWLRDVVGVPLSCDSLTCDLARPSSYASRGAIRLTRQLRPKQPFLSTPRSAPRTGPPARHRREAAAKRPPRPRRQRCAFSVGTCRSRSRRSRSCSVSRFAHTRSTRSPKSWPWVSLTPFKPSRSPYSRAPVPRMPRVKALRLSDRRPRVGPPGDCALGDPVVRHEPQAAPRLGDRERRIEGARGTAGAQQLSAGVLGAGDSEHFPNELAGLKCLYLVTRSLDPTGQGPSTMHDAVEASAKCVRDHLRRPIPGRRNLLITPPETALAR